MESKKLNHRFPLIYNVILGCPMRVSVSICRNLLVLKIRSMEGSKQSIFELMPTLVNWSEFHLLLVKDSSFCDILIVKFEANKELAVQTRLNGWKQQTLVSQTQCISVLDIRHIAVSSEQDTRAGILQMRLNVLSSCVVTGQPRGTCGHLKSQQNLLHLKGNSTSQE